MTRRTRLLLRTLLGLACAGLGACGAEGAPDLEATTSALSAPTFTNQQLIYGYFNSDEISDLLVVTSSGTTEYLGQPGGGFTVGPFSRPDLKLGNVAYLPGVFRKSWSMQTDLLIVTPSGSYEYLATLDGDFTPDAWVNKSLTLGNVEYTLGRFSSVATQDLIATTSSGSSLYTSNESGGFSGPVWTNTFYPLGTARFTAGAFFGQLGTDSLIVTTDGSVTAAGSKVLVNDGTGHFTAGAWSDASLSLGKVSFAVARFAGGSYDALLVTSAAGTSEYVPTDIGGNFTRDVWLRTNLTPNRTQLTVGYFHAEAGNTPPEDVIITTDSGSYLYTGKPGGGFTANVWTRTDLTKGTVAFFPGNFDGVRGTVNDVIITRSGGSYEYLGTASGVFKPDAWVRKDLTLGNVQLF